MRVIVAVSIFAGIAQAQDLSTWAYGSPGDFRRWANERRHEPVYPDYAPVIIYDTRGIADAKWMDTVFRASSPELYRYTMPQPPQTNIIINYYSTGVGGESVLAPEPQPTRRVFRGRVTRRMIRD